MNHLSSELSKSGAYLYRMIEFETNFDESCSLNAIVDESIVRELQVLIG